MNFIKKSILLSLCLTHLFSMVAEVPSHQNKTKALETIKRFGKKSIKVAPLGLATLAGGALAIGSFIACLIATREIYDGFSWKETITQSSNTMPGSGKLDGSLTKSYRPKFHSDFPLYLAADIAAATNCFFTARGMVEYAKKTKEKFSEENPKK